MVSMECIGAVALSLLYGKIVVESASGDYERSGRMGIGMVMSGYDGVSGNSGIGSKKQKLSGIPVPESKDKTPECMAFLKEKSEEILEKLRNGETEAEYPIGGESYTEREWDKLLEKFDDIQEDVRRKMEERFKKMEEKKHYSEQKEEK